MLDLLDKRLSVNILLSITVVNNVSVYFCGRVLLDVRLFERDVAVTILFVDVFPRKVKIFQELLLLRVLF